MASNQLLQTRQLILVDPRRGLFDQRTQLLPGVIAQWMTDSRFIVADALAVIAIVVHVFDDEISPLGQCMTDNFLVIFEIHANTPISLPSHPKTWSTR